MATQHEQRKQRIDPFTAQEDLRDALEDVGIVIPSLGVDYGSQLGLVELGRVRADVAIQLAEVIRRGSSTS